MRNERQRSWFLWVGVIFVITVVAQPSESQQATALRVTQDLRIDGVKENFVPISWIVVRKDGTMAIWQGQDLKIRFYGPDGSRRSDFGRGGDGPGEFRSGGSAGFIGDTLWVADSRRRQATLISPTNTLLRVIDAGSVHARKVDSALYVPTAALKVVGIYSDGRMLLQTYLPIVRSQHLADPTPHQYVIAAKDGEILSAPITVENPRTNLGIAGMSRIPFVVKSATNVSPDGLRVATVVTSRLAASGSFTVAARSPQGSIIWSREVPFVGERIPSPVIDSQVAILMAECANAPAALSRTCPEYRAKLRGAIPAFYPPAREVLVGRDGSVWVGLRRTEEGQPWLVLDGSGNIVGMATMPGNTKLRVAELGRVWGTQEDMDGVESVVRFAIGSR